ncbi:MAG: superoxide dismutase, partial [Candidatus Brocadiia bacterium]
GIYDDPARFTSMAENLTTIEKSMNQINTLSQEQKPNYNQIVRWVQNKEDHADELTHTVTYYFLAQRIKPVDKVDAAEYDNYIKKLTLTHAMISYCTKAKQSTDTAAVAQLRTLLDEFKKTYELEHNH